MSDDRHPTETLLAPRGELKASHLLIRECQKMEAILFIRHHHSRLPNVQSGPWMYAFAASHPDTMQIFAAALWNNPSARTLPSSWLELRRMAVAPEAPHCTASAFLAGMTKTLRREHHRHFISYQDREVHLGTIYKAAGWTVEYTSKPRVRKRGWSEIRQRDYRTSINGAAPDVAGKNRWGICYGCGEPACTHQNEVAQ